MQSVTDLDALARMKRTNMICRKKEMELECKPVLREEIFRERVLYSINNRGSGNI
jgi:hypothetical protein